MNSAAAMLGFLLSGRPTTSPVQAIAVIRMQPTAADRVTITVTGKSEALCLLVDAPGFRA